MSGPNEKLFSPHLQLCFTKTFGPLRFHYSKRIKNVGGNMKISRKVYLLLCLLFCWIPFLAPGKNAAAPQETLSPTTMVSSDQALPQKTRFMVVSSYHREYIWSQETNAGLTSALRELGYLDTNVQIEQFTRDDFVESSRAVVKKAWMNTKQKNKKNEIAETLERITKEIDAFKPDIILLGDDNAANYVGNYYLDTQTPIVFWGINGLPVKYGIVDSLEKPGHNVTGVYQMGYHYECFEYLQKVIPSVQTVAVLSDDSPTGRAHAKRIQRFSEDGQLPVKIAEIVITNSFAEWKAKALALQEKVDAFYVATHNTMVDEKGDHVDYLEVAAWYLRNIHKPETTPAKFLLEEGFFSTVEDSAFKQGYEALMLAHRILTEGVDPGVTPPTFPTKGPFIINRGRARMLGLEEAVSKNEKIIDEFIDTMVALEKHPQ
jgi:ABC-type uncharacterized transport system substrate-binding protein